MVLFNILQIGDLAFHAQLCVCVYFGSGAGVIEQVRRKPAIGMLIFSLWNQKFSTFLELIACLVFLFYHSKNIKYSSKMTEINLL